MDQQMKDAAQDFFKQEVEQYKKEHYESGYRTFMSVRQERFLTELDSLNLPPGARVLDAGCGPGFLTKELVARGYETYAIDTSPDMLRLTRSWFENMPENSQPSIQQGNVEAIPFADDYFDAVISPGVIEYLQNDTRILAEIYRILKPGGYMILSVTNKLSPIGYLEPLIEGIKRNAFTRGACNFLLEKLGRTPVRARNFKVRKHRPKRFKENVERAQLRVLADQFFYFLPWPHPLDRIFPYANNSLGRKLESLRKTRLAWLGEGYYVLAKK